MYEEGLGVAKDYGEAMKWYKKAAEKQPLAQYNLGRMYEEGLGVAKDYAEAVKWYDKAAENDRDALVRIVDMYERGIAVDDETVLFLPAGSGNGLDILFIVDEHTFLLQLSRQIAWCLVIAGYDKSLFQEVAGNSTHADATCSYEIDSFDIFQFHILIWLV